MDLFVMYNQGGNLFWVRLQRYNPLQGLWYILHIASKWLSKFSMDALTLLLSAALWKAFTDKTGFYQQLCKNLKEGEMPGRTRNIIAYKDIAILSTAVVKKGCLPCVPEVLITHFGVEFNPNSVCLLFQASSLLVNRWLCWSNPVMVCH